MAIAELIRRRRHHLGLTQEDLAKAVFVTPQAVSQWENGKTMPDPLNLSTIADTLQVSKAELVGELDTHRPPWAVRDAFFSVENMRHKLQQFAVEDGLEQMARAIDYADEAHAGQTRKPSIFSDIEVPYIFHPYVMACHAHALGIHDDVVLTTALLHDVCEDCGISVEELPFSREVREAVALLTKPADKAQFSADAYWEAIATNPTAAVVKAIDRCNNVSTMMSSFSHKGLIAYVAETERYAIPLLDSIKHDYPEYYDVAFALKYQIYSTIESVKAAMLRL